MNTGRSKFFGQLALFWLSDKSDLNQRLSAYAILSALGGFSACDSLRLYVQMDVLRKLDGRAKHTVPNHGRRQLCRSL